MLIQINAYSLPFYLVSYNYGDPLFFFSFFLDDAELPNVVFVQGYLILFIME